TILDAVDDVLRLLDAHAHLKWFGHHGYAAPVQHGQGIAGTVADGEQDDLSRNMSRRSQHAPHGAVGSQVEFFYPAGKADFARQPRRPGADDDRPLRQGPRAGWRQGEGRFLALLDADVAVSAAPRQNK